MGLADGWNYKRAFASSPKISTIEPKGIEIISDPVSTPFFATYTKYVLILEMHK